MVIQHQFNNIKLSFFASHMKLSFPGQNHECFRVFLWTVVRLSLIQLSSMTAHKGAFGLNIKLEPRFGQRKSGIVERVVLVLSCLFLFCLLSKVAVTLSLFRAGLQSKYVLIMKKVQEKAPRQFHNVWKSQNSLIQHCERSELRYSNPFRN